MTPDKMRWSITTRTVKRRTAIEMTAEPRRLAAGFKVGQLFGPVDAKGTKWREGTYLIPVARLTGIEVKTVDGETTYRVWAVPVGEFALKPKPVDCHRTAEAG